MKSLFILLVMLLNSYSLWELTRLIIVQGMADYPYHKLELGAEVAIMWGFCTC